MPLGKIKRSFNLIGKSLSVLRKDKELLLFPLASLIGGLFVTGIPVFLLYRVGFFQDLVNNRVDHITTPWFYLGLFLYYVVVYFVGIFFSAALVKCVYIRLKGGNPTFSDGIKSSLQNIKVIFLWSLIASTVGIVLVILEDKLNRFGAVIGNLGQLAWSYAVLFVVPVMIIEKESGIKSVKRSASIFAQRWGEAVVGGIGVKGAAALLIFLGLAVIWLSCFLFYVSTIIGLCVSLLYVLIIVVISMTLSDIFTVALYHYATSGESSDIFPGDLLKNTFEPKRSNFFPGHGMPGFPGQQPGQI